MPGSNDPSRAAISSSAVASAGMVSEIDMTSGTPQLVIGTMEVGLGDIANVANVTN